MPMRFRLLLGFLAVGSAVVAAACSGGEAAPQQRQQGGGGGGQQPAVPVTVAPVVQKPMPLQISVIGAAEAYATVAVRAQITGGLTSVNFDEGDDVKMGQVLFTLDRRPLEAALQQLDPSKTEIKNWREVLESRSD